MGFKRFLIAMTAALMLPVATIAAAEEITFKINNEYDKDIQIEFYSQSRNHAWPGGNQAYNLNSGESNSYRLSCNAGEKICYGGWVKGNANTYWGVGLNGKYSCDSCCQVCGDGDLEKTLN